MNGDSLRFDVMDRPRAERYRGNERYAMISIGDPGQAIPDFSDDPNRLAVARLTFFDISTRSSGLRTCGTQEARILLDFFDEMRSKVRLFAIHCEAGISRSWGVALGLSLVAGDAQRYIEGGYPNALVVHSILCEHERRTGEAIPMPVVIRPSPYCPEHLETTLDPRITDDGFGDFCARCNKPAFMRDRDIFAGWAP
jgi:hypothetical protein